MSQEVAYTSPRVREAARPAELDRPFGPAAAVVVAAGLAAFVLGLLSVLTAVSASVSDALTLSERVGDVSGLSVAVAVVFFGAWGGLFAAWRESDPRFGRVAATAAALVALGLLGTFPPFFDAIGG
jgi:hypothetical protein